MGPGEVVPYTSHQGLKTYYEVEGSDDQPPLLMLHAAGVSLHSWRDFGFAEALGRHFRLIFVDALGHGRSESPDDPESYRWERQAERLASVLDAAAIDASHVLGYSMGGVHAFGLLARFPERVLSSAIGGAPPPGMQPPPPPDRLNRPPMSVEDRLQRWRDVGAELSPETIEDIRALSPESMRARDRATRDVTSLRHEVVSWATPTALFVGELDPFKESIVEASTLMRNGEVFVLPDLTHIDAAWRSEVVLPLIEPWLLAQARL